MSSPLRCAIYFPQNPRFLVPTAVASRRGKYKKRGGPRKPNRPFVFAKNKCRERTTDSTETGARECDTRERALSERARISSHATATCFSRAHRTPRQLGLGPSPCANFTGNRRTESRNNAESGVDAMDPQTQMMLGYHYLLTRAVSMGITPHEMLSNPRSDPGRNAVTRSLEAVRRQPRVAGKRTRAFAFPVSPRTAIYSRRPRTSAHPPAPTYLDLRS